MARNSIQRNKKRLQEASTSGTTWINSSGKIIQADEGRNKKRLLKEKVGQDIKKVRSRQKSRSTASKLPGAVKDSVKSNINWLRKKLRINK